jgi:hypothetical protein
MITRVTCDGLFGVALRSDTGKVFQLRKGKVIAKEFRLGSFWSVTLAIE